MPICIKFFRSKNFLDDPGGRKIHTVKTPAMGGLPIFVGFTIAILTLSPFYVLKDLKYVLGALMVMFIVGFRDDFINLKAIQKLFGQLAAALIIVLLCDIRLVSFYDVLGVSQLPLVVSYFISLFTIIVITNAYNLIDGIDGLSGSVGLIASLFFGIFFWLNGELAMAILCFSMVGALFAFLKFNWAPSKIFMGDTGALFIGFFLSIVAIQFIDLNHSLVGTDFSFQGSIGTALAILIIPLADTLRVFVKRSLRGRSPMYPDRTHVHHILLRLGCTHAQACGILITVNVIFVLLALVLKTQPDIIVIPAIFVTAAALSMMLDAIFRAAIEKRREELKEENSKNRRKFKVVPMNKEAG